MFVPALLKTETAEVRKIGSPRLVAREAVVAETNGHQSRERRQDHLLVALSSLNARFADVEVAFERASRHQGQVP